MSFMYAGVENGRMVRIPVSQVMRTSFDGSVVTIRYRYSAATPDVWHLRNGDPGYPGDPAEVEIQGIVRSNGIELDLASIDDESYIKLENECITESERRSNEAEVAQEQAERWIELQEDRLLEV